MLKKHLTLFDSCFITAYTQLYRGFAEVEKKEFKNALRFFTGAIDVKCKSDWLNAELYFIRSYWHRLLGEFIRLFIFRLMS